MSTRISVVEVDITSIGGSAVVSVDIVEIGVAPRLLDALLIELHVL